MVRLTPSMPTIMSHAVVGIALGSLASFPRRRPGFWMLSAALPMLPDLDVLGLPLGISFRSMWGHRGISHSLLATALVGAVTALLAHRHLRARPRPLAVYFALITASHGMLDALTDGGPGVAFLAPFDDARHFFPWRPIPVSPLGSSFFSAWGWHVFSAEVVLLWLPAAVIALVARLADRR
jgi:inner membrane protein